MAKPKRPACGVKSGKSRSVSKNNKICFQQILVTAHLRKTLSFVSASVWQKQHKGDRVLPN